MIQHNRFSSSHRFRQKVHTIYQQDLVPLLHNRAAWLFGLLWLLSAGLILLTGQPISFVGTLVFDVVYLFLTLLTLFLTPFAPTITIETSSSHRKRLWLQLAILLLFVLLIGYYGLIANNPQLALLPPQQSQILVHFIRNFLYLINSVLYFVLPMIILLLLKVRWQDVGFGYGTHSWRVVVLWAILPFICIISFTILDGWHIFPAIIKDALETLIAAGFAEEFLFRGALLTRLRLLFGTSWSVVLSSLLFGLWHLGTNLADNTQGNYLLALAYGIFSQSVIGLCLSIVFIRTRNLVAPIVAHTLFDTLSALFS